MGGHERGLGGRARAYKLQRARTCDSWPFGSEQDARLRRWRRSAVCTCGCGLTGVPWDLRVRCGGLLYTFYIYLKSSHVKHLDIVYRHLVRIGCCARCRGSLVHNFPNHLWISISVSVSEFGLRTNQTLSFLLVVWFGSHMLLISISYLKLPFQTTKNQPI